MRLFLALVIPSLLWDSGPETAPVLKQQEITAIAVPTSRAAAWQRVPGISLTVVDPLQLTRVLTPSLADPPANESAATRRPWVNSNGWRFLRNPQGNYLYEAPGVASALAAAESFTFGVPALIHTDDKGLAALGRMLTLLRTVDAPRNPSLANIGFVDDGTEPSAEFMNLLVRKNLLFQVFKTPDPKMALNVIPGSADYPQSEAGRPSLLAERVRDNLNDEKRLLRIFGSDNVIGRLEGTAGVARLYLINYGGAKRPIHGLRVRVLGRFSHQAVIADTEKLRLFDIREFDAATEFTIPELTMFAVIDLSR
jgi:hypothetical protein